MTTATISRDRLKVGLGRPRLLFDVLYLCLVCAGITAEQHPATADEGPLSEVQTAVGLEVALPCDLMPGTMIADKVQLVIWYREGNAKPIYTFDARGRPLQQAIPWADENVFKNKAHFYYDTNPPALRIKNIQTSDAGLYKCRVDFHKSPTRNWRINVTVLVPPTQLTILDHHGAAVRDQLAGPYLEGDNINLTCLSSGGIPPPRVSWWKEHALVDDSFQVLPDGTVRNILHLRNIGRNDLLTVYTCQASNGHVVAALSKKVKLDMNLPPLSLLLQGLNHALVAGTRTHVTCTAIGARPPPQIVWSKGGQIIRGATQSTSSDGNTTISELILIPVPEDNERQVVCSISLNPRTTSQQLREGHTTIMTTLGNGNIGLYLKDSRTLNVTHAPIVSLNLGAPLDPNNLMKGSDVYLECEVKANPSITRVEWYHNDKQLHSSRGIIISNQTLVLQGILKTSHGLYFCRATNIQGSVSSNEVYLDIKYPPICMSDSTVIRAALKQIINITCQVDSNPLDNVNYKWHFNNSLENLVELPITPATVSSSSAAFPLNAIDRNGVGIGVGFSTGVGYHQRIKRKQSRTQKQHQFSMGRHDQLEASDTGNSEAAWAHIPFEDIDDDGDDLAGVDGAEAHDYDDASIRGDIAKHHLLNTHGTHTNTITLDSDSMYDAPEEPPYTQMVYSNIIYNKNHLDGKQIGRKSSYIPPSVQQSQQQFLQQNGPSIMTHNSHGSSNNNNNNNNSPLMSAHMGTSGLKANQFQLQERKRLATIHKHQQQFQARLAAATTTPTTATPLNNVYRYHIETYDSFGAISCVASNPMGQSQPCWYHIQPADLPDPVKNCTAFNVTANSIQIQCIPGYDGGIPQHFHAQIYDELNRQILYNASYKYSDFTLKRLPSDSVFVIRVTAVNAQGSSKVAYRLRARTLSAPLLRTASSTAVLVQLTPLLGALVGVIATLVLVAICIVIFIKFRSKRTHRSSSEPHTVTDADKGSAEPLSRNMGSHSSLEEKNPDVVPQEANSEDEFHLEEKAFDRLNIDSQRILYTPSKVHMNATPSPPPPSLSPTFAKQYGELSLTTNPAYSLYNTPQRAPATQRPVYTAPPPLLSTRSPPNIYTRIPGRSYLPAAYETRASPTSPYGSTTTCTLPLLGGGQSNGSLQTNSSSGVGGGVCSGSIVGGSGGVSGCNTLPHHPTATTHGIPSSLTSSVTSGNITIGAAQSLLTAQRSPPSASPYGSSSITTDGRIGSAQTPLLASSMFAANSGNYETLSS